MSNTSRDRVTCISHRSPALSSAPAQPFYLHSLPRCRFTGSFPLHLLTTGPGRLSAVPGLGWANERLDPIRSASLDVAADPCRTARRSKTRENVYLVAHAYSLDGQMVSCRCKIGLSAAAGRTGGHKSHNTEEQGAVARCGARGRWILINRGCANARLTEQQILG